MQTTTGRARTHSLTGVFPAAPEAAPPRTSPLTTAVRLPSNLFQLTASSICIWARGIIATVTSILSSRRRVVHLSSASTSSSPVTITT